LPSSLTEVLPFAWVFSTHLPVSVWGTGSWFHRPRAFSRPWVPVTFRGCPLGITGFPRLPPTSTRRLTFLTACARSPPPSTGILTGCPSPTPAGLGLGPTNPTRTDLPSETLDFRRLWFSHICRYSCRHSHSRPLQRPFRDAFTAGGTLPYHDAPKDILPKLRCMASAPLHYPRSRTRPVSCYALFQGWLLLSQPPGCLHTTTSFPT
jgi:hypothetical protein